MFDRRPTADDARFDELLERMLRDNAPAEGPAAERDVDMARLLVKGFATYRHTPDEVTDRVWTETRARVAARDAAASRPRTMPPARRVAIALVALALLLGAATPLGRATVTAAEDAVAAAPEFMSQAVAGTRIEGWFGDTSEPVVVDPDDVIVLEDGRIGIPAQAVSTVAPSQ